MRYVVVLWWVMGMAGAPVFAGTLAQFRTAFGDIDLELFDQDKPITVANFLRYVRSGVYQTNNMFFHRCIPNFVLQGGGFATPGRELATSFLNAKQVPVFSQITNEFLVGKLISNTYGTIAMAKLGDQPNSASSQWFFNLKDNNSGEDSLDTQNGGFTVFGKVVRGTNVLNLFNLLRKEIPACSFSGIADLRCYLGNSEFGQLFSDLPVNYFGTTYPRYSDLFYVDITLLGVHMNKLANGSREIVWTSVNGRPNVVEYTLKFPPAWQMLTSLTGDGSEQKVTDTDPLAAARFYRVRVDYD